MPGRPGDHASVGTSVQRGDCTAEVFHVVWARMLKALLFIGKPGESCVPIACVASAPLAQAGWLNLKSYMCSFGLALFVHLLTVSHTFMPFSAHLL